VVEPRTLDASLVVHVWMESHDRVIRARIVDQFEAHDPARGIDDIVSMVRVWLERTEHELSGAFDRGDD
jgi:hypothetical protein